MKKKKRLRRNPERRTPPVRTPTDKTEIIDAFQACASTEDQATLLRNRQVSRSSIFRWKREMAAHDRQLLPASAEPVTRTIATLCMEDEQPRPRLIEAVATFSAWLRWPHDPGRRKMGTAVLIARYLAERSGNKFLAEFSRADIDALLRNITLNDVATALGGTNESYAPFDEFPLPGKKYAERHLLRDIIAYMIAERDEGGPTSVSLNKAYYLIEGGAIGHYILRSRRTYDILWKGLGVSAPFHFVEQDDCSLNWYLDPFAHDYADYVDEIIDQAQERRTYFSKCTWVVQRLRERLSQRALAATPFAAFPAWLQATPTVCPPLSQEVRDQLTLFGEKWSQHKGLKYRRTK